MESILRVPILLMLVFFYVAVEAFDASSLDAPIKVKFYLKNAEDGTDVLTSSPSWRRRLATEEAFITAEGLVLAFAAGGENFKIHLSPADSVFTDGCKVHTEKEGKIIQEDVPKVFSFSNDDNSAVITFIDNEQKVDGMIRRDDKAYHIVSVDPHHLEVDTTSKLDGECATAVKKPDGNLRALSNAVPSAADHLAHRSQRELTVNRWSNCYDDDHIRRTFNIGIAIGSKLYIERFGSKSSAAAFVESVVADANQIYAHQLNIELKVNDLYIQDNRDAGPDWMHHKDNCVNTHKIDEQLDGFTTKWNRTSEQGLWHYFDDCFKGGVVGMAWQGALCGKGGFNTGVTWYTSNGSWKTFAHEVGHNFAARHSFEEGQGNTGGIMDYGDGKVNGEYQFNSKYRKDEVCKEIKANVNSCKHFGIKANECSGNGTCRKNDKSGSCNNGICMVPIPKPTPKPTPEPTPKINTDRCEKYSKHIITGTADLYRGGIGYSFNECAEKCFNNNKCKAFTYSEKSSGYCETWKTVLGIDDMVRTSQDYDTYVCSEDDSTGDGGSAGGDGDGNDGDGNTKDSPTASPTTSPTTSPMVFPTPGSTNGVDRNGVSGPKSAGGHGNNKDDGDNINPAAWVVPLLLVVAAGGIGFAFYVKKKRSSAKECEPQVRPNIGNGAASTSFDIDDDVLKGRGVSDTTLSKR